MSSLQCLFLPLHFITFFFVVSVNPHEWVYWVHGTTKENNSYSSRAASENNPFRASMLILLASIIIFHITSATFLFISTIDSAWWVGNGFYTDVWHWCANSTNCTALDNTFAEYEAIQTVQATMILSTILCCVALFTFIIQLFGLKQGERFILTSTLQLLSCLCVMIGASIYTDRHEELHKDPRYAEVSPGHFGYSYVLAWLAFAFTLVSGLMYLILRKRK